MIATSITLFNNAMSLGMYEVHAIVIGHGTTGECGFTDLLAIKEYTSSS